MDQLFMFSNEYTMDDSEDAAKGSNKEDSKIKNEPEDIEDDGLDDDSYIMPESLLQQMTTTPDADGEDDNTIFNFGIEPSVDKLQPSAISKPYSTKNPQDVNVNYDIAIMFICPCCGEEFDTQIAWKSHINGVHEYNTRRGLNFVPIDKLYHKCLECNKPIAMHAMENLLKHKFTHLPHRCTKCKICHRLYKYRQDLIVHLRLMHRDEVLSLNASANSEPGSSSYNNSRTTTPPLTNARLEIRDIKGNAVDIFENTCDSVEVKNEPFDPDDPDGENLLEQARKKSKLPTSSILEDVLSRGSTQVSDQRQTNNGNTNERQCEKNIKYICPVCSTEFRVKNDWLEHVQEMHNFCSIRGLGFQQRTNASVECRECKRVLSDKSIEQLQLHKFSHLPSKTWLRCKLCLRAFSNHKDIVRHLLNQHRLDDEFEEEVGDDSRDFDPYSAPVNDHEDDQVPANEQRKNEVRDIYETQIDYLCPKCGEEFLQRKFWRKHIVKEHGYTDLKTLCFVVLNEHQLQCRLCGKIITNAYGVQNAQQHYFTHLPHKAYIRCRICAKAYTDRKGLVKHLRKVHHINPRTAAAAAAAIAAKAGKIIRPQATFQPVRRTPTPVISSPRKAPVKEIVRHHGVTYEIQFLDEDNNDDSYQMQETSTSYDGGRGEYRYDDSFATPTKRHVCADCYSTFSTAQALQKHTREQHDFKKPSQAYVCSLCFCTFESGGALHDHKLKHHPNKPNITHASENNEDDDLLLIPSGNEDVKSDYNTGAGTQANFEQYFCYLCPACGEEFKTQYEWRRHINDIHYFDRRQELNFRQMDKFNFQCLECKEFVNSAKLKGLQDHKFRHLPFKLYIKCRLCSTCYNHKPNMVTHLRIRHNLIDPREAQNRSPSMSPLPSPSPQMRFNTSSSYDTPSPSCTHTVNTFRPMTSEDIHSNHNAVDHESITYRCPQCNEPFDTHASWRQHIVSAHDLNSRPGLNFRQLDAHHYICLECYKRVTVTHTKGAIGQLQSHKFRHLPYKSFCCTKCYGQFVRKQMFFKHLNRHTNRCPMMGNERIPNFDTKAKSSSMGLMRAIGAPGANPSPGKLLNFSITSKEKCPYIIQCPQCGIKFEKWHPWREHIEKVHALHSMASLKFKKINDHLHICIQCKERVSGANFVNLQTHRFKHLPYGTYLHCRYCDVRYYYMINIIKHMKQKHPNHGMEQLELQLESADGKDADASPVTISMEDEKECVPKVEYANAADDESQKVGDDKAVIIDDDEMENENDNDTEGEDEDEGEGDEGSIKENFMEYRFGYESSKNPYIIQCPQCGIKNDNWYNWSDHIAQVHSLGDREQLNFTKISDWLDECNECKERINSTTIINLQTHKLKHLPHGAYLHCPHCDDKFDYIVHIVKHLNLKHPEHVLKHSEKLNDEVSNDMADNDNDAKERGDEEEPNVVDAKSGINAEIDLDAEVDEQEDEDDDDEDDDEEEDDNDNENDNDNDENVSSGDVAEAMDIDDKSEDDFEDGEDDDENDDDDVDDDDDDDDEDGDDDEIETYGTKGNVADTAVDSENTNTEAPRGVVEDIEETVESEEQLLLG
ncbi:PREDICTED: zinc finger protein 423-like [Rhagoletis zephyria]|uniref:zinc finger protein 423-like n=1 Tax=Rhagoletis zephyria TaxID=28612 RepID=UPI00081127D8|nr:PREDICTED: zinc finger protein 423-like [Rhagoletis zephyria]XP_017463198.1 PREDICTED: zinc finger protein 423-like [Rhagoletis zephyria]XP_017463205.1 PREDICTED: zinc finger protein 423-like [Rhagoletis zephyria]